MTDRISAPSALRTRISAPHRLISRGVLIGGSEARISSPRLGVGHLTDLTEEINLLASENSRGRGHSTRG